jgi:hypothetical protein
MQRSNNRVFAGSLQLREAGMFYEVNGRNLLTSLDYVSRVCAIAHSVSMCLGYG